MKGICILEFLEVIRSDILQMCPFFTYVSIVCRPNSDDPVETSRGHNFPPLWMEPRTVNKSWMRQGRDAGRLSFGNAPNSETQWAKTLVSSSKIFWKLFFCSPQLIFLTWRFRPHRPSTDAHRPWTILCRKQFPGNPRFVPATGQTENRGDKCIQRRSVQTRRTPTAYKLQFPQKHTLKNNPPHLTDF